MRSRLHYRQSLFAKAPLSYAAARPTGKQCKMYFRHLCTPTPAYLMNGRETGGLFRQSRRLFWPYGNDRSLWSLREKVPPPGWQYTGIPWVSKNFKLS